MFTIVGQCLQCLVSVHDGWSVFAMVGQIFAMVSQSAVISQCLLQLLPTIIGVQCLTPPLTSSPMTSSFAYYLP